MPKHKLTTFYLRNLKPQAKSFLVWDPETNGLAIQVRPNNERSWKFIYSIHDRVRWYTIGSYAMSLEEARVRARRLRVQVDDGKDPQALKLAELAAEKAKRSAGTVQEIAGRYLEYAKTRNKSWEQAARLIQNHVLPRLGTLKIDAVIRDDIERLKEGIAAPIMANQVLAATSAVFTWAIKRQIAGLTVNPCRYVERHPTKDRERVLSNEELPKFWAAFEQAGVAGQALQLILLLGQRPGEISHLRSEHLADGWWEMPGEPVASLGWPGTKNGATHRVWIPEPARAVLAQLPQSGFLLAENHGRPVERLDQVMRNICRELGIASKVTPHDLRRTHGTKVCELGFGREAMNRIQNHREGGIADVYDQHSYARESKHIWEAVAAHILAVAEGREPGGGNVVALPRRA